MASEEFAKWVDAANPEAILAGANAGVAYVKQDAVEGTKVQGGIAGAGLGLLGSYTGADSSEEGPKIGKIDRYFEQLAKKNLASGQEKEQLTK